MVVFNYGVYKIKTSLKWWFFAIIGFLYLKCWGELQSQITSPSPEQIGIGTILVCVTYLFLEKMELDIKKNKKVK